MGAPVVQVAATELVNGVEVSVALTIHAQALQHDPEAASLLSPAGSTSDEARQRLAARSLSAAQALLAPARAAALESLASLACEALQKEAQQLSRERS